MRSYGLLTSREMRPITLLVRNTLNNLGHEVEIRPAQVEIRLQPQSLMKMSQRSHRFVMYLSIENMGYRP
jgi:hypothetical protein